MNAKMTTIRFLIKLSSYLPWELLDNLQPKKQIANKLKKEIVIEKYLHQGRKKSGKKGVYKLDSLRYEPSRISFYVISKVISFCTWCHLNGYIPEIAVKVPNTDNMLWETLFEPISFPCVNLKRGSKITALDIPVSHVVFDKRLLDFWKKAFSKWVIPNDSTEAYCEKEYKEILKNKRCLGVLVRGTDYTALKPKGHGVQPTVEQVIEKVKVSLETLKCDYIYLATEEKRIFDLFDREFPGKVLINKRLWYDEYYNGYKLIGEIHHTRENDEYLSSLEYYSSLNLLSKCVALVAGNCGGSVCAVLMNGGKYEYMHIFDLGSYK